jgi:hypothetical protein
MHQVLLENIPLPDLDDPKSLVHRLPRADKKQKANTTDATKAAAKGVKEVSDWYKKEKRARAVKIRLARNFALVHKLLPGRLLFSDMQKTKLKLAGNVPCVYWAHYLLTSMHKEGKATGLYQLYVLGQVNTNVLALAAAESRLKIWGTDLFPAGSGEQVERPDNWGLTSLHRILGAADGTDREYRGVVSEDGSALSEMSASVASKDGVEITPSAVGTGTEGLYKHVMQAYHEEQTYDRPYRKSKPPPKQTQPVVEPVPAEEKNVQLKEAVLPELRQQKRQQEETQQEERTAKSDEKAMQTDADAMRPGREDAMAIAEENATQQKEEEGQLEETEAMAALLYYTRRRQRV